MIRSLVSLAMIKAFNRMHLVVFYLTLLGICTLAGLYIKGYLVVSDVLLNSTAADLNKPKQKNPIVSNQTSVTPEKLTTTIDQESTGFSQITTTSAMLDESDQKNATVFNKTTMPPSMVNSRLPKKFPDLDTTRKKVRAEIQDFLKFVGKNESQLIPELGGSPVRCILATTWRSGSSFTGQALGIHPGAFYHYEPLWKKVGMRTVRESSGAESALTVLKSQLLCNYSTMQTGALHLLTPNVAQWFGAPVKHFSPREVSSYCRLYPVQIIKIVRLGSTLLKTLLDDASLNIRVIMLVRDPRAVMQSRNKVAFCRSECKEKKLLCDDQYADYQALKELKKEFPGKIMAIRFEDIASNPAKLTPELFDFCGLQRPKTLTAFLESHTNPKSQDFQNDRKANTYRNTSNVSLAWKESLTWDEINTIQETCDKAMNAWGYIKVKKDNLADVKTYTENIPSI